MARPRKPATLKQGKSETKEHLDDRAEVEENLKGNDDKIHNVPDSLDELGKRYYLYIVDELEISGILGNLDVFMVTQTADCLSKMEQLDEIMKHADLVFETMDKMGNIIPKEHPAIGAKMKYLSQFRALSTQLGLSPSSRAQLSEMNMDKKETENDALLNALKE